MTFRMAPMHVAASELVRLAPDALRGLGFSYPLADRAAPALVWGETVHGLSLRFLSENGAQIEAATRRCYALMEQRQGPFYYDQLDAKGKCLLEAGPRALDLAQSRTASGEAGFTLLTDTSGGFLAGELVTRAIARGYSILIAMRSSGGKSKFEGDFLLCGIPSVGGAMIHAAGLHTLVGSGAMNLASALGLGEGTAERVGEALRQFAEATNCRSSRLAVVVCRASAARRTELSDLLLASPVTDAPSWCGVCDFDRRQSEALLHGLEVDPDAWKAFGLYIQRTRVQTSDRSRTQAG